MDGNEKQIKIVWGITGAGDYLVESIEAIKEVRGLVKSEITVLLSREGDRVVKWYKYREQIESIADTLLTEKGPNTPFIAGPLQLGRYDFFYVSPVTANTCAKVACGIADTLITNCITQSIKGSCPVYLYPVDQKPGIHRTETHSGEQFSIKIRDIDIQNVQHLRNTPGIEILSHPADIVGVVKTIIRS